MINQTQGESMMICTDMIQSFSRLSRIQSHIPQICQREQNYFASVLSSASNTICDNEEHDHCRNYYRIRKRLNNDRNLNTLDISSCTNMKNNYKHVQIRENISNANEALRLSAMTTEGNIDDKLNSNAEFASYILAHPLVGYVNELKTTLQKFKNKVKENINAQMKDNSSFSLPPEVQIVDLLFDANQIEDDFVDTGDYIDEDNHYE